MGPLINDGGTPCNPEQVSGTYYSLVARKDVCFELGRLLMSTKVSGVFYKPAVAILAQGMCVLSWPCAHSIAAPPRGVQVLRELQCVLRRAPRDMAQPGHLLLLHRQPPRGAQLFHPRTLAAAGLCCMVPWLHAHTAAAPAQSLELDPQYADARTWYRKVSTAMVRASSAGQAGGTTQWQRSTRAADADDSSDESSDDDDA